jgi:uncharacterized protein (TIGR02594 family)
MTAFDLAQRFVGEVKELPGAQHHPFIQWCHQLVGLGADQADETAWCSSFANGIAWMLRLPRSKSARARSWLTVGAVIPLNFATPGYDVVILKRGTGNQPDATVLDAQGHVGFYAGHSENLISVLGGNQANGVTIQAFPMAQVLGIRRLA